MKFSTSQKMMLKSAFITLAVCATIASASAVTSSSGGSGAPGVATASSVQGSEAFQGIWTTVKSWAQGTLGKTIAITMALVGLAAGVLRQSLVGIVVGIGGAIGLFYLPIVIESIMGATASISATDLTSFAFWANF